MDKSLYFFIYYPRTQKEIESDINFIVPEKKSECPECIYSKETYDGKDNKKYYNYKKIYKITKSTKKGKDANKYHFEFQIEDDKYVISFDSGENTFIYDVNLEVGKTIIHIRRKINQNIIEYNEKIDDFVIALEENNLNDKMDLLYKDTIDLYSKKKGFGFLISLFVRIYQKKDLCSTLLNKFKEMNSIPKDNEKNLDRKPYLKNFSSKFEELASKAEQIIKDNKYNTIEFFGIILCYLNFYDIKTFSSAIDELSSKNNNDIFEILLIYNTHFENPINKDFDFFDKFVKYTFKKKDFSFFKIAISYITDIENFLKVIDTNKDDIYINYIKSEQGLKNKEKYIIKLENDLIFKKEEKIKEGIKYPIIMDYIDSLLTFSSKNETLLIQFTSDFWNFILNNYKEPILNNIYSCSKLREAFIKYYNLLAKIIDKKSKIFIDTKIYEEIDEFAFLLDQIIKGYFIKNKQVTDIEKLVIITKYNPYYNYNEPKYSNKVDTDIFDSFSLSNIDDEFIENFTEIKFELIFKENIHKYISKIVSKIQKINDFENIIELINFNLIKNKNIVLDLLVKRYDNILGKGIDNYTGKKLAEAVKVLACLAFINFIYKTKNEQFDFINDKIGEISENIQPLIFIEIIKLCISEGGIKKKLSEEEIEKTNEMKTFLFEQFSREVANDQDINNIIRLINCLEGNPKDENKENEEKNKDEDINNKDKLKKDAEKNINEFLKKLLEKNLFTKD